MAIQNLWLQGTSGDVPQYPARADRTLISALWDEGVLEGGIVTASGTDRVVTLAATTRAVIDGDDATGQGAYLVTVTAAESVTLDAAPASGSRIDLVGLRVRDLDESGAAGNDVIFDKVTGVSGSPGVAPAVPSSFLVLWEFTVNAGDVALTTGTNRTLDRRVYTGPKEPIGTVRFHAGPTATIPVGWEVLAGQAWSAGSYPGLNDRLGITTAPDGRGRVPRGVAAAGTGSAVRDTFGADDVTLVANNLPVHTHPIDHDHASFSSGGTSADHTHTITGGVTGGVSVGHTHSVSITSGGTSSGHTHAVSGTSANQSADHTHSVSITSGNNSVTHTHSYSGTTSGRSASHTHSPGGGGFWVAYTTTGPNAIGINAGTGTTVYSDSASNTESVDHTHTYSGATGSDSVNHTHLVSGTSATQSASHTHTFSVTSGGQSADHTHLVSGTSGSQSADHTHTLTATTGAPSAGHTHTVDVPVHTGASGNNTTTAAATSVIQAGIAFYMIVRVR